MGLGVGERILIPPWVLGTSVSLDRCQKIFLIKYVIYFQIDTHMHINHTRNLDKSKFQYRTFELDLLVTTENNLMCLY